MLALAFGVSLSLSPLPGHAQSGTVAPAPVKQQNSASIWFENWRGLSNAKLTIVYPDGQYTDVIAEQGTPVFTLVPPSQEGVHEFKLTAETAEQAEIVHQSNTGREEEPTHAPKRFQFSGYFVVENGVILNTSFESDDEDS